MNDISVIIPAYNAEKTVARAVRSVLASTIKLDVYVVDDGSTDATGLILDDLLDEVNADRGSSGVCSVLHVIHQCNQGAYAARLNALKHVVTQWIGFVDADDTIETDMYEKMLSLAEREKCDVVQCGVDGFPESELGRWYTNLIGRWPAVKDHNSQMPSVKTQPPSFVLLGSRSEVEARFIYPHLVHGHGASFMWNKLYRNQYDYSAFATFDRLTNYDDMIFNFQFFEKVRRMGFLRQKLYHYSSTTSSATHRCGIRQLNDYKACALYRITHRIPSNRWVLINARSACLTILRSHNRMVEKLSLLRQVAITSVRLLSLT